MYLNLGLALLAYLFFTLIVVLVFNVWKERERKGFVFLGAEFLEAKRLSLIFKVLSSVLSFAGFFYLLLALARPQDRMLEPKTSEKGIDIVFSLDISDSMLIEDMAPYENRLESAKHHIKEFMGQRTTDRLGLVIFSGEAYTRVPLTTDHNLLLTNLADVAVSEFMKKGTAIGVALAAAVNRIKDSESKSKVIVLLTDGENNTGVIDPLTALDLTVDLGARVYTIGIGRDGRSMLPVFSKDRYGRKVKSYRPFPTKINEKLLREIAVKTGGRFYRASEESDLAGVFESIDKLEKTDIKLPDRYKVVEKFQSPLLKAVICFALLAFLELSIFWRGV
ncbi:MAG: VWA domain-containing protein [Bdellovibrionales bacterium]